MKESYHCRQSNIFNDWIKDLISINYIDFIKRHLNEDKLQWNYISENPLITWDSIESNPDLPWNYLGVSKNPNITIEILKLLKIIQILIGILRHLHKIKILHGMI